MPALPSGPDAPARTPRTARRPPAPRTVSGLLATLLAVVLLPLLVLSLAQVRDLMARRRAEAQQTNLEVARLAAVALEARLRDVWGSAALVGDAFQHGESPQALALLARAAGRDGIDAMVVLDARGRVVAATDAAATGDDWSGSPAFVALAAGGERIVTDLLDVQEAPSFLAGRAVRDASGALQGAVVARLSPSMLAGVLPVERPRGGTVSVIDGRGTLVLRHPNGTPAGAPDGAAPEQPLVRQALAGREAVGQFHSPSDGTVRLGAAVPLGTTGWVIRASVPAEQALAQARRASLRDLGALGLLALLSLGAGGLVARSMARAVKTVHGQALAWGRGELQPPQPTALRETTDLSRTLSAVASELRRSEREALAHAMQLDAVLDAIADGLVLVGADGRLTRMNARAAQLLGGAGAYVRGRFLREPGDAAPVATLTTEGGHEPGPEEDPVGRALSGCAVRGQLVWLRPAAGPVRLLAVSAAPLPEADGTAAGAVATLTDVTPLHELQEQRQDLVRMVSHDLRSPLSVVLAQAQMIERRPDDAARTGRAAAVIRKSAARIDRLIQDMVDSVRLDSGQLQLACVPLCPAAFVEELAARLEGALPVERLRLQVEPRLPEVLADPDRLERVVVNLLSNAFKYSPAGSPVRLELRAQADAVTLAVHNEGPPIPAQDLPHVFERFYRTATAARAAEGLGLGLHIARRLVEAHGGSVSVESGSAGTAFRVVLPAAARGAGGE